MANNEIRHLVGTVADPISLIEGAHAWTINLAGTRRVTIVRPDGVAVEVWPAAPMVLGRLRRNGENRDDFEARSKTRYPPETVMLGHAILWVVYFAAGFGLGAWLF